MQTSIDAVHIIPALDLVHGEIGKGYRVLVTATGDQDHPHIFDIKIKGFLSSHPD